MAETDRAPAGGRPRRLATAGRTLAEVLWLPEGAVHQLWSPACARLVAAVAGLYGLIVALAAATLVINDSGRMAGGLAFLLLPSVVALALAAYRPLDGWRLGTLCLVLTPFFLAPPPGSTPPLEPWQWCLWSPVLFAAAWSGRPRQVAAVAAVSVLAVLLVAIVAPWPLPPNAGYLPLSLVGPLVPVVVGASLGARRRAQRDLAAEQRRVAETQAARGALTERARIAREMHDVVAHHLSLIAVRCETAPYRLAPLPEPAGAELAEVAGSARRALTELQRLLGVLRVDEQLAERAPQPGIDSLPELFAAVQAAGTDLSWQVSAPPVADTLGLSVYRIVQQALANAARHAPGAAVRAAVVVEGGGLRVVVENGPGGAPGTPGTGLGLVGVRERAQLHGGRAEAGPTPDGGFRVSAFLPVDGGSDG